MQIVDEIMDKVFPVDNRGEVFFSLPLTPTPQMRARSRAVKSKNPYGKRSHIAMTYKHSKQEQNEKAIQAHLMKACPKKPYDGPLAIFVVCYMPIAKSEVKKTLIGQMLCDFMSGIVAYLKKPDADNLLKQICDCMNRVKFWHDDKQVPVKFVAKMYDDGDGPRWEITLVYKKNLKGYELQ